MKKLIITPKKDTITICLPQDWVGKPLVCILKHPEEKSAYPANSEFVSEVREETLMYNVERRRRRRAGTEKRLRRREK